MPHTYENYDVASKTYTSLRVPIGADRQLKHFSKNPVPLGNQKLLDAGCGTGNYSMVYLDTMHSVHCSDYNHGMLNEAKARITAKYGSAMPEGKVMFSQNSITDLGAIPGDTYDAICLNQVVHHLRQDNDFLDIRNATSEFFRVLKPGGRVAINWSTAINANEGMYWAELIPRAMKKWLPRTPDTSKMEEILKSAGFSEITFEPLLDEILYDPSLYFEPRNFLDIERFRKSDSTFALAEKDEIEEAVARVQKMADEGSLDDWFKAKEMQRKEVGQSQNAYATKLLN